MTTYLLDPADPVGADFTAPAAAFAALDTGDILEIADGAALSGGDLQAGGVAATGITLRWRDGLTRPVWNAAGALNAFKLYHDWTIEGLEVVGCSRDAFGVLSGTPDGVTLRDCVVRSAGGVVSNLGDNALVERLIGSLLAISGGSSGGVKANGFSVGCEFRAVLLWGCAGGLVLGASDCLAEHVTIADGAMASGVACNVGAGVARNVIVYRPGVVSSGIAAGTFSACLVFEPTTGVQYAGHSLGVAPAGSLIADPLFYDAPGRDYRLSGASPALATGDAAADTLEDVAGILWASVPRERSRGAFASVPVTVHRVFPRGSHTAALVVSPDWPAAAFDRELWAVSGPGSPLVAEVTGAAGELVIRSDLPFRPGEAYTVTPLSLAVHSGDLHLEALTFEGMPVSRPERLDPRGLLVDFAAGGFGEDGAGGGGLRYTEGGDYATEGGLPTIERMIWAVVLTQRGELARRPDTGSRLRHKAPPPPDLRVEERWLEAQVLALAPYVTGARVALRYEGEGLEVEIDAQTKAGRLSASRVVPRGGP